MSAQVLDFKFYVHDISAVTSDGGVYEIELYENEWQLPSLALLDFQDKSDSCSGEAKATHTAIQGKLPASVVANTVAIQFKLGVPAEQNHENQAVAVTPLNIAGMFWSWQSGYKFARMDVAPVGGITRPGDDNFNGTSFNFHLGSTACGGDPSSGEAVACERGNRPLIRLEDYRFDRTIVVDYAELV